MKTCSALFFLLLTIFVSSASAQNKQKSISQIPDVEPFSISRGKSFSASPAKPKSFAADRQIGANQITEDFAEALELIRSNHVGKKRSIITNSPNSRSTECCARSIRIPIISTKRNTKSF
jgi:hypothetical protein